MSQVLFKPSNLSKAILAAVLVSSSVSAYAIDDENVEHIEVKGEKLKYKVDTSNTATKTNTLLRDIPQVVTVVTEQQIADQSMQSMADVVRYVAGVQMSQGEGHRDAPIFRGNISTADFFVNGVRDDVQYLRDLYNVERIDVLKGPAGMIFGRGGVGGLINRVTKQANFINGGVFDGSVSSSQQARMAADVNQVLTDDMAVRMTAMYENSDSFRQYFNAERSGFNPSLTYKLGQTTTLQLNYEHFSDERLTDRGGPSDPRTKKPLPIKRNLFIGSVANSQSEATVDAFSAAVTHDFANGAQLVNQLRYADYDKYYDNVFAGAYTVATDEVALSSYNSATARKNLINQTDVTFDTTVAGFKHKVLIGAEYSKQDTDNLRLTGYFTDVGANTTSIRVPMSNPLYLGKIQYRAAGTDADNHSDATASAIYVQDQVELSSQWLAVVGARYDHFKVDLRNHRNNTDLSSSDDLVSPRAGLIYKPVDEMSLYVNYSKAYMPRAGEQLAGLSATTAALDPEAFVNKEVGFKWDINSSLSFGSAVYTLDRTNVAVTDPANPSLLVLVDGQRVRGLEAELQGQVTSQWDFTVGYAHQDSEILAPAGQKGNVLAQVPRNKLALWNKYQLNEQWGLGLGMTSQSASFIAVDNAVTLPGFSRFDAAVFYVPVKHLRLQLNVENITDKHYAASAHNNNNIMPGTPANARLSVSYKF